MNHWRSLLQPETIRLLRGRHKIFGWSNSKMMFLRAPSGNAHTFVMLPGSAIWGPHAQHGGRGAWGGAPLR